MSPSWAFPPKPAPFLPRRGRGLFAFVAIQEVRSHRALSNLLTDIEPLYRDDPAARRIMEEAGNLRLKQGFTIPMVTLEGDIAGLSLAGGGWGSPLEERRMLTLMATYALARSIALRQSEPRRIVALAQRELEVLQWAAEGPREREISERMGVSDHWVDKHVRSARSKLGARSRVQPVAEAIRLASSSEGTLFRTYAAAAHG